MQFKSPLQILTVFLLITLFSCTLLDEIKELNLDCDIGNKKVQSWLNESGLTFDEEKRLSFRDESFYAFGLTSYLFARVKQPKVQYQYFIGQQIPHYEFNLLSKIPINNSDDLEDWLFNTPEKETRPDKTKIESLYRRINDITKCFVQHDQNGENIVIYSLMNSASNYPILYNLYKLKDFKANFIYRATMAVDLITAFAHVHSIGGTVKYNQISNLALKHVKDGNYSYIPSLIQFNNLSRDTSVQAKINDYYNLAMALANIFNENLVKESYTVPLDQRTNPFNECNTHNQFERFDVEYCAFIIRFVEILVFNQDGNLDLNELATKLRKTMLQMDKLHVKPYEEAKWINDYANNQQIYFNKQNIKMNLDEKGIKALKKHASAALEEIPIPYDIFKHKFSYKNNEELQRYFNDTIEKNRSLLESFEQTASNDKRII